MRASEQGRRKEGESNATQEKGGEKGEKANWRTKVKNEQVKPIGFEAPREGA